MHRHLPTPGTAHREAAYGNTIFIDAIALLGVVRRLEHVDLAGELERIAIAAIRMQDERIRRSNVAALPHSLRDERILAERFAATVKPEVKPEFLLAREAIRLGNHQPIRLHRLIELGTEASHDESRLCCPRSFALEQLIGSFDSCAQQVVWRQRMCALAKRRQAICEYLQLLLQRRPIFRRDCDPGWWNLANILRNVVARPIRKSCLVTQQEYQR